MTAEEAWRTAAAQARRATRPIALAVLIALSGSGCGGNGPEMVPGQDCMAGGCHRRFTLGGTIYARADSPPGNGVGGALVVVTDADGQQVILETNAVGNFWYSGALRLPLQTEVRLGGEVRHMQPAVDRGSCNSCHSVPPTNGAAGLAYVQP